MMVAKNDYSRSPDATEIHQNTKGAFSNASSINHLCEYSTQHRYRLVVGKPLENYSNIDTMVSTQTDTL